MIWPDVVNELDTLNLLLSGKSISRYGDGEFELISGNSIAFQKRNTELATRLNNILYSENECLVAIPNLNNISSDKLNYWSGRIEHYASLLNPTKVYHSSFVSRPDHIPEIDNEKFFRTFIEIWENKPVIFLIGDGPEDETHFSNAPSLFSDASRHKIWRLPSKNAFKEYDAILSRCLSEPKDSIFCISLGPTASVLSFDLSNEGFQAIDAGSFPRFYNWRISS